MIWDWVSCGTWPSASPRITAYHRLPIIHLLDIQLSMWHFSKWIFNFLGFILLYVWVCECVVYVNGCIFECLYVWECQDKTKYQLCAIGWLPHLKDNLYIFQFIKPQGTSFTLCDFDVNWGRITISCCLMCGRKGFVEDNGMIACEAKLVSRDLWHFVCWFWKKYV